MRVSFFISAFLNSFKGKNSGAQHWKCPGSCSAMMRRWLVNQPDPLASLNSRKVASPGKGTNFIIALYVGKFYF